MSPKKYCNHFFENNIGNGSTLLNYVLIKQGNYLAGQFKLNDH